jgi:hypothetical protein
MSRSEASLLNDSFYDEMKTFEKKHYKKHILLSIWIRPMLKPKEIESPVKRTTLHLGLKKTELGIVFIKITITFISMSFSIKYFRI